MAIDWVNVSSGGGLVLTLTMNVSHAVPAGSNRLIVAWVSTIGTSGGPADVTAVTRNGQSFTKVLDITLGSRKLTAWVLTNATTGTFNIGYTFSRTGTVRYLAQAHNFTGCDQTTPVPISEIVSDSGSGATSYSANAAVNVPYLFTTMVAGTNGSSYWNLDTANATTTFRANTNNGIDIFMRSWTVDAATDPYTATYSHTSPVEYFFADVPINAADSPPPPANPVTNSAAASLLGVYKSVARNFVASMLVTDVFSGQVFHGLGFSPNTISVTLRSVSGASAIGSRLTLLSWDATVAVFGYVVAGAGTASAVNDIYFSREHSIVR